MRKFIKSLSVIVLLTAVSCSKDDDIQLYEFNPRSFELAPDGGSYELSINSTSSWTLTTSAKWLTVTPLSGSGNMKVTVSATQNTDRQQRSAMITIRDAGGQPRSTATVYQGVLTSVDNIIIAHRGAYKEYGHPDNSLAALKKAVELGFYGSECDINITTDGQVIVIHGESFGGLPVLTNTYATLRAKATLSNGEPLPLLSDFLKVVLEGGGTKLFIDVKSLSDAAGGNDQSIKAGVAAAQLIREMGAEDRVTFIVGRLAVFKKVAEAAGGKWPVAYMNHDLTPQKFLSNTAGLTKWGNFDISNFGKNPATNAFDPAYASQQLNAWNSAGVELSFYNIDTEAQIQWYLPYKDRVKACSNYPTQLLSRVKAR